MKTSNGGPKINSWRQIYPYILTVELWVQINCIVTSHTETLNCDISSLENDTEIVDHYMNPELSGFLWIMLLFS